MTIGAVSKLRWTSWAPVPNKPTVSVDVKQHFNHVTIVLKKTRKKKEKKKKKKKRRKKKRKKKRRRRRRKDSKLMLGNKIAAMKKTCYYDTNIETM